MYVIFAHISVRVWCMCMHTLLEIWSEFHSKFGVKALNPGAPLEWSENAVTPI